MSLPVRVARYLRPYRGRFLGYVALVLLIAAAEVAKPWPLKIVVDHVLGDAPLSGGGVAIGREALLVMACVGTLVLHLGLSLLVLARNRGTISLGQRMVADLRRELLTHLQRLSLPFFGRRRAGDLVYRLTYDTFAVQTLAMNGFFPLTNALLLLAGMGVVMVRMNPTLAATFLAVVPLLFAVVRGLGGRISSLARRTREDESWFLSEAQRGVESIAVVQSFTAEPREHERVMRASSAALSSAQRLSVFETVYSGAVSVVLALGTAAVLYGGGRLGLSDGLSAGELVVFVSYLNTLYVPITQLSQVAARVRAGAASARRVFEVLDEAPEVRDAPGARPLDAPRGEVSFEDVSFAYDDAGPALQEVSFVAQPGMRVALVGPTGAGKTTLACLIPRFYDPDAGRVRLDGVDLRELELRSLRAQVGLVPQVPLIFPATLAENIRYGRPEASDSEVVAAAELAGVRGFAERLPRGFETPVGPEGRTLSQGQAQRITIARALLKDPRVLLLDEPTSALDPETEAYVMEGLERASKGRTTFVIAHRLSTVRRADLVLVLDAGRLVETGSYEALRRAGGLFQRLHDAHRLFDAEGG